MAMCMFMLHGTVGAGGGEGQRQYLGSSFPCSSSQSWGSVVAAMCSAAPAAARSVCRHALTAAGSSGCGAACSAESPRGGRGRSASCCCPSCHVAATHRICICRKTPCRCVRWLSSLGSSLEPER